MRKMLMSVGLAFLMLGSVVFGQVQQQNQGGVLAGPKCAMAIFNGVPLCDMGCESFPPLNRPDGTLFCLSPISCRQPFTTGADPACVDCRCNLRMVYIVDDFEGQYTFTECSCCPDNPDTNNYCAPRYAVSITYIDENGNVVTIVP